MARLFWQTTSWEQVLDKRFKFIEVENPSLLRTQGDFGHQIFEARAVLDHDGCQAQIRINDVNVPVGSSELEGALPEGILQLLD